MLGALVLAAGKGERLRPLTSTRPKPLIPAALGETLLGRWLKGTSKLGISEVVVVVKEKKEQIVEYLKVNNFDIKVVEQGPEQGTGAAIRDGLKAMESDEVLVIYSDVYLQYLDRNLSKLIELSPSILAYEVDDVSRFGALVTENGVLNEIKEKSLRGRGMIFAGVFVAKRKDLEGKLGSLKPSPRGELEVTDILPDLGLKVVEVEGGWTDVGRPWDILDVMQMEFEVREGFENPWGPGKIYGEVPKVKGDVYVEGPAYFGKGVELGPFSHIRPYTALLNGVKVGPFVQIKNSYIMEDTRVPHLNYVGDSIVAEDVNFGAGSITANLRFDEKNVKVTVKGVKTDTGKRKLGAIVGGHARIGINVSLMPGVKVGAYSWIYPGCVVTRDVNDWEKYNCWKK